jgi:hypothetical protein
MHIRPEAKAAPAAGGHHVRWEASSVLGARLERVLAGEVHAHAASGRDQVPGVSGQVKAPVARRVDDADATGNSSIVSVRGTSTMKPVKLGPRRIWPA